MKDETILSDVSPAAGDTLPSAADLDAHAKEQAAKEATGPKLPEASPLSTVAAIPDVPEQLSAAGFAPQSALAAPSFLSVPETASSADPGRDTTKQDSLGNEKSDQREFGPKGEQVPPDGQTPEQRQASADKREAKLSEHMPSTAGVDSTGQPKGEFRVIPQGFDKHGARIPDKVDHSHPVEAAPEHVGPRGVGAPPDTFHGARPKR